MKELIKRIPVVGSIARAVYRLFNRSQPFAGSREYWVERYRCGGNSGDGSYNALAEFKAEVLNDFVSSNAIRTVIEYGCGDGNQLKLANYPSYTGFDVSPEAVARCRELFGEDPRKKFKLVEEYQGETAELTLSLDVIYHLTEDEIFSRYMNLLFDSSSRFVAIYSSDTDQNAAGQAAHVRHRNFSKWVRERKPGWKLIAHIPNRFPYHGDTRTGSFADFYLYGKES